MENNLKVIWLTGLSGAGKTTIAKNFIRICNQNNLYNIVNIDGDTLRSGVCSDLNFSIEDRKENIRRASEISNLFINNGINCICTFISPTEKIRALAKQIIGEENFIDIYINTPISVCMKRDVKGLYKKVKQGEITNFTGITSPFEKPKNPFYTLSGFEETPEESALKLFNRLKEYLN